MRPQSGLPINSHQSQLAANYLPLARIIANEFAGDCEANESDACWYLTLGSTDYDPARHGRYPSYLRRLIRWRMLSEYQRCKVERHHLTKAQRQVGRSAISQISRTSRTTLDPRLAAIDLADTIDQLSPPLAQTARLLAAGIDQNTIATQMGCGRSTVSRRVNHLRSILAPRLVG